MFQIAPSPPELMKAYHSDWENEGLLLARAEGIVLNGGEAWKYKHTHKDAKGKYDLWFRYPDPLSQTREATLRDWFAGQALAGVASSPDIGWDFEVHAKWIYAAADAMLAAREVKS